MYPTDAVPPAELPGPPDAPAAPRGRPWLRFFLAVTGTVLLVGVPSAVALFVALNRAAGDQLVHLVPANADVYTTVLLDPSLSQKRNLQDFLQHFPDTRDFGKLQKDIARGLDGGFKSGGIDYTHDVEPWLGGQVGVVARIDPKRQTVALLVRTTDEAASTRALQKVQSGEASSNLRWSTTTHSGVVVHDGADASDAGRATTVWAVLDHTAVVGSADSIVDAIIDSDQGRAANLGTQKAYLDTLAQLPSDHVAVAYVNAAALIGAFKSKLASAVASGPAYLRDSVAALDAYRSFGGAVSVQSNSVSFDGVSLTDPAKLTALQRAALTAPRKRAPALSWVPADSYAVLVSTGPSNDNDGGVAAAIAALGSLSLAGNQSGDNAASTPDAFVSDALEKLGITGDNGIVKHLTGDAAMSLGPGRGRLPFSAAVVVGTDDSAGMESVLARIAALVAGRGRVRDLRDGDAVIHVVTSPGLQDVAPAYAVVDGYAVIGTDPASVRAAIEAHRGTEAGITASRLFRDSPAGNATGGLFYLDVQDMLNAVISYFSPADRASYDKNRRDVIPLRTLVITGSGDTRHQSVHMVLSVG